MNLPVRLWMLQGVLLYWLWSEFSFAAPIQRRDVSEIIPTTESPTAIAIEWLHKYQYIETQDLSAEDSNFTEAVKQLQRNGGLKVTGELDDETLTLINTSRCGVTETGVKQLYGQFGGRKKRYTLQGTKWRKLNVTYRFLDETADLSPDEQKRVIRAMINKWAEVIPLTITEELNPSVPDNDVDILIRFVTFYHQDPYPFDGLGGTLAHAYYPHNNEGLAGDAHFDDSESFTTGTSDGINLDWVAVHEFGHSLGLEHSNVRESIMYPWYKGYFPNIELTYDDIAGVRALYPSDATPSPTPTKKTTTTTKMTTSTKDTTTTSTPKTTSTQPGAVDICKLNRFDEFLEGKNKETYVFSGDYYWVLSAQPLRVSRGPLKINSKWKELSTPITAAYKDQYGRTIFFKGQEYWKYNGDILEKGPSSVSDFGLSSEPDTAFVWGGNKKTYFFKDFEYWRYNIDKKKIDGGYPRTSSIWGLSKAIDSALTWEGNGRTYFFKDNAYWRLNDGMLEMDPGYPRSITQAWLRCTD